MSKRIHKKKFVELIDLVHPGTKFESIPDILQQENHGF